MFYTPIHTYIYIYCEENKKTLFKPKYREKTTTLFFNICGRIERTALEEGSEEAILLDCICNQKWMKRIRERGR